MMQQIADLEAEGRELHLLLATLKDDDWRRPTLFKAWTIDDMLEGVKNAPRAGTVGGPGHYNGINYQALSRVIGAKSFRVSYGSFGCRLGLIALVVFEPMNSV